MSPEDIVLEARSWVGVPYRERGRSRRGVDCLGLLVMLGRSFDVAHEDEAVYTSWPTDERRLAQRLEQYLTPLPPDAIAPGVIGMFTQTRLPAHVGVFTEKHGVIHLIHARMNPRRVVEEAYAAIPRAELRLSGLFCFPAMDR